MNKKNIEKLITAIFPIFLTLLGAFLIVDGEIDDSPGEMLLGCLAILSSMYLNIKNEYRTK